MGEWVLTGPMADRLCTMDPTEAPPVVLDGFHAWKHATRFNAHIMAAYTDDEAGVHRLIQSLAPDLMTAARLPTIVGSDHLTALCHHHGLSRPHHTRLIALAVKPGDTAVDGDKRRGPVVLVDQPRSPGNLGAVIRVAAAADIAGVLTAGSIDIWHRDVVRAAAGLHFALPVGNLAPHHHDLGHGPVVILDPGGEDLRTTTILDNPLIVVGAERSGVSEYWRSRADQHLALPMRAGVSSLNLATSVSAILYHLVLSR